jgi:hypothetical protein
LSTASIVQPHTLTAVQQDWIAWIPCQSLELFEQVREELDGSCVALAVILNEALDDQSRASSNIDPEMALLFAGLFERLADRLASVLDALEQHGRAHGTRANATPLRASDFRSAHARLTAYMDQWRQFWPATGYAMFHAKIESMHRIVSTLRQQAQQEVSAITGGQARNTQAHWRRLEPLQDDLNTCLQETTIVLKSFFCAIPASEVPLFRDRLAA